MIYLFDTNIVSYWMRGDGPVIERIRNCKPSELSICTITLTEIHYGIEKSPVKKRAVLEFKRIANIDLQDWAESSAT